MINQEPITATLQDETRSTKFGLEMKRQNRRALSVINHNLVGSKVYPCVVNKRRGLSVSQEETKKLKPSVPSGNAFGDCIFIDEDEENEEKKEAATLDQPMPMSLEEPYIEESDPMEEEDEQEPVLDIDGDDVNNPLAVVEYVEDLHEFYRKNERFSCVPQDYMGQQFDITDKMRAILIDWLIEVHDKFELMNETLYLTVNLIDRFLSKQAVVRKKLQLVGLVALLLACKYEEVSVPIVEDLVVISDKAYTRNDVLEMEKIMLNTLQFNMSLPTQYPFLKRFLKAAKSDKKLETLASFLIELALVDYEMLRYQPSLLAASAVYTAQCTIHGFSEWNSTCEFHSHYSENQLRECSRRMVSLHQKAATDKLTGVRRKYSSSKFGYIATKYEAAAAHFLLVSDSETL
ncbi:Cyclin-B2-2 [Raphanus sativus]|uniref:Cyclin-B2-2 n=1 Tax=Raphanus sativus TaxID=3726 RepID=A0A6J0N806_RAPSA|nr:cyclin-B2-2 [Raphanus sativus]KAJ4898886.1 Cyclin-B2-2 [Raphanus sativus]